MPLRRLQAGLEGKRQVDPRYSSQTLVVLFAALILIGGLLLNLPVSARSGEPVGWLTAYFTATSAVCVTGLAVVDTVSSYSFVGQLILLILIQLGGIGYMTASTFVALVLRRELGLRERLVLRETLGQVTLRDTMRLFIQAMMFTFLVELLGAIILSAQFALEHRRGWPEAVWRGIFHSVSAFCNAGFDLFGLDGHSVSSLGGYRDDPVVNFTIMGLIVVGGLGFPVVRELAHYRGRKPLSLHTRVVLTMTAGLTLFGTLAVLVSEWSNPYTLGNLAFPYKLQVALFQSVTARTAGFATVDFADLRSITLLILGLLMFIGASPSGTGGGIKTTTMAVIFIAVRSTLKGHQDAELFRRRVPSELIYRALVLVFLSFAIIVAAMFTLVLTEPAALQEEGITNIFMRIQFEVISAFATVGLSTGITPALTDVGRMVIMTLMFIGRLGPLTVASALAAPTPPSKRHYPEEKVALG